MAKKGKKTNKPVEEIKVEKLELEIKEETEDVSTTETEVKPEIVEEVDVLEKPEDVSTTETEEKTETIEATNNQPNSEPLEVVKPQESTDNSSQPVNKTVVKEEIKVLTEKEKKRLNKEAEKERIRLAREKEKMVEQHRKKIKNHPEKLIRYETDPELGLSEEIVEKRILDNLVNQSTVKTTQSVASIIFSNVFTFFNILTLSIAIALIIIQAWTDLVFLVIVTANIIIGIIQQIKSKKTIDRLSLMSAPTAIVKRAGNIQEINVNEVVLDDLILLENGKQICADSIVVEGTVEVNESLLTGESDAVIKKPGDLLYAGSFVVSGRCSARVDKVGNDNYISTLSSQAKKYKRPKSDLWKALTIIIVTMGFVVIIMGFLLFVTMYIKNGLDLVFSIRKTAGAMIGMIPSGLFLMTSIALAVGVIRLGQKKVLVQELYCIEMLARVNCICLDKTGTITDGTMSVKNVIDYNTISGLATRNIISAMLNALNDNNLTSKALQEKFGLGKRIKHVGAIPFSSQRKYQAVTFDKYGTFILGAPEFVLKEKFSLIKNDVNKHAALGYRVLCLAHRDGVIENGELPSSNVEIVSLILIEDNIRPDAINTIRYFKESGVEVRVISGDNPLTVSKISQRAGIDGAEEYVSLDGMSDNEVKKAALKYTVFGRVSPSQKKLLIQTLKEAGKVVAMTGDGVNDILALKEADCSIAVASGSEAARNVSHLVLLDSNFDSMPSVVAEGRRVINNVTSVASLFLTKTMFSLLLAIQALLTGSYPISTNQLIIIDTMCIGLPSLFLVMEPNNNPVQGKFLYNVLRKALPGALVILIISAIVIWLSDEFGFDATSLSTIIVIAATHTCMMVLFKACKPFNTLRKTLCTVCYSVFLFVVAFLPQFLEFRPIFKFTEYYSENISTKVVASYPQISVSKENYYVIDGVYTTIVKDPNNKGVDNLTSMLINNGGIDKYYYAINGNVTYLEVAIPDISYRYNGVIYLGGYAVKDTHYSDLANNNSNPEDKLVMNSEGYLYYSDSHNNLNPINITLPKSKNNEYYGFDKNYGMAEDAIVQYRLMPTIEIKNGELLINGVGGETIIKDSQKYTYKYFLQPEWAEADELIFKIDTTTRELLINDQPVVYIDEYGKTYTETYKVALPKLTTDGNNTLYIGAVESKYNVFELFGNEVDGTYTIYRDSKEISYNKATGKIIDNLATEPVEYESINSYMFKDINYGFGSYNMGENGTIGRKINIDLLSISPVNKNAVSSQNYYLICNNNYYSSVLISDSSLCPDVNVAQSDRYVINGYYTNFVFTGNDIDLRIDDQNRLIIGNTTTDYVIPATDIITYKGELVKQLNTESKVFLLMTCLMSAPLMKILQGIIPWIKKQIANVQKFLTNI